MFFLIIDLCTGHLQRALRDEAGPRRDGGGLRQRERQGLLDREELMERRLGRGRLHPDGAQRALAQGQVRHRHGPVVPGEVQLQLQQQPGGQGGHGCAGDGRCLGTERLPLVADLQWCVWT